MAVIGATILREKNILSRMKTNKRIENLIPSLRNYFGEKNVEKVIMFGSFALDTASKRSDLDLIVIKKANLDF